jgi:hypothetical protein
MIMGASRLPELSMELTPSAAGTTVRNGTACGLRGLPGVGAEYGFAVPAWQKEAVSRRLPSALRRVSGRLDDPTAAVEKNALWRRTVDV